MVLKCHIECEIGHCCVVWGQLGHFWSFQGQMGAYQANRVISGRLVVILCHLGPFLVISGHFRSFLPILSKLSQNLPVTLSKRTTPLLNRTHCNALMPLPVQTRQINTRVFVHRPIVTQIHVKTPVNHLFFLNIFVSKIQSFTSPFIQF